MINKKIVEINSMTSGSTGHIMFLMAEHARAAGYEVWTSSAVHRNEQKCNSPWHLYIGGLIGKKIHVLLARKTGWNGCFSRLATRRFLKKLDRIHPDLLHFHNLHNSYINLPMLFRYVKEKQLPVVWTLHDCWSFTGHCAYFDFIECNRWKTGCGSCPHLDEYPTTQADRTKQMYQLKTQWFTGANITLVTPSRWLGDLVQQSFLHDYPVKTIYNGIDLNQFKPTSGIFREKYHVRPDDFLLLGVANVWEARKGLDVMLEMMNQLDASYRLVLVGVSPEMLATLPEGIIGITRTENIQQLAEIYTAADLFVNTTQDEVFGLVNVEALACGTGVVTFRTGGAPEAIDETCGVVVDKNDLTALCHAIEAVRLHPFAPQACRARAERFAAAPRYAEYLELYRSLLEQHDPAQK